MTNDEIKEQTRRGTSDAQLLVVVDRNHARALLLQYQMANPLRGFMPLVSTTLQDVYDDSFFRELEERLTISC